MITLTQQWNGTRLNYVVPVAGSRSNSAVQCADGRVLYCWTDASNDLWLGWAADTHTFLSNNETITGAYKPFTSSGAVGCLTKLGSTIYLTVTSIIPSFDPTNTGGYVLVDASGNGAGPWALHGTIFIRAGSHGLTGQAWMAGQITVSTTGRWLLPHTVNAADFFGVVNNCAGLLTSDDYGVTWTERWKAHTLGSEGVSGRVPRSVFLDKTGQWCSGSSGNTGGGATTYSWRSSDDGATWVDTAASGMDPLVTDPYDDFVLSSNSSATAVVNRVTYAGTVIQSGWPFSGAGSAAPLTGMLYERDGSIQPYATGIDRVLPMLPSGGWQIGKVAMG